MRDLATSFTSTDRGTSYSISGLVANTQYTFRFFAYDSEHNLGAVNTFYNTTATTTATAVANYTSGSAQGTLLGSITNRPTAGAHPTNNTDYSLLATVTSNANGVLSFGQTSTNGPLILNGFVMVPEPSSAMALVSSIALLLGIRRRRTA